MNLEEYIICCKHFAHDTEGWGGLADCKFYTTDGVGCWDESCDNAHGGLDIAWAFHCTDAEIESDAKWRYDSELEQELNDALDDRDFDLQQWHATFEKYSMPMPETVKACRAAAAVEIARMEAEAAR